MNIKDTTALFVFLDDFCKLVDRIYSEKFLSKTNTKSKTRIPSISMSEMLTIMLIFQQSPCLWFKYFYLDYLPKNHGKDFQLVSYNRFIQLMPRVLPYMMLLMQWYMHQVKITGISFIDVIPFFQINSPKN